jgi:hypothetical protein
LFQANLFVHFKPYDHDELTEKDVEERGKAAQLIAEEPEETEGLDAEEERRRREDLARRIQPVNPNRDRGQTALHVAASRGDLQAVEKLLQSHAEDEGFMHARDGNQWQAIHEAAKAGLVEVLQETT